jgi:hypothetical protein
MSLQETPPYGFVTELEPCSAVQWKKRKKKKDEEEKKKEQK